MSNSIDKLLSVAGLAHLGGWALGDDRLLSRYNDLGRMLAVLLQKRNGFFAFESALQLLPLGSSNDAITLGFWNERSTWRAEYGNLIRDDILFFCQDAFGYQFALDASTVYHFDPETADLKQMASSLEEWAAKLLGRYNFYTGYELAHQWQTRHGALNIRQRLIPKVPFVLGGAFDVSNLYAGDIVEAMRFRASLAKQIADLPEGTPATLKIV